MIRAACAVLGAVALLSPAIPRADVDAVTFITAFRAGNADQYKTKQVSGTGVSFHGAITERLADDPTRTRLALSVGSGRQGGQLGLSRARDQVLAGETGR